MAEAQDRHDDIHARPDDSDTTTPSGLDVRGSPVAGGTTQTQSSSPTTSLSPPSKREAQLYYYGLPSRPKLVARTGPPWKDFADTEDPIVRELSPLGDHPMQHQWEGTDGLNRRVLDLLDELNVRWTSIDPVRFRWEERYEVSSQAVVWIGVVPGSLSSEDGVVAVLKCKKLLEERGVADAEVEIRESVVTRSAGPKLLRPARATDYLLAAHREPLTPTVGLPICARSTRWVEGTGGLFFAEGGSKKLFLVTARHVVFKPNESNELFQRKHESQPRHKVILLGDAAFDKYSQSLRAAMENAEVEALRMEERFKWRDAVHPEEPWPRETAQWELDMARAAIPKLKALYHDVSTHWTTPESRVLGHVVLSPPLDFGVGSEGYTEDWAVIEVDPSKVNASNFSGNAVDLGHRSHDSLFKFCQTIYPNSWATGPFHYPFDRLLRLNGTIPIEELRHPAAYDEHGETSLVLIKRGSTTGVTVGPANTLCSYVRHDCDAGTTKISKEWPVFQPDCRSGPFSEPGDSGSVLVDGRGRTAGLLTSGAGTASVFDITYFTPISFLLERMQHFGIREPNINPDLTA